MFSLSRPRSLIILLQCLFLLLISGSLFFADVLEINGIMVQPMQPTVPLFAEPVTSPARPLPVPRPLSASQTAAIVRQRIVALEPAQVAALAGTDRATMDMARQPPLWLNFFEDANQTIIFQTSERLKDGAMIWTGKVSDSEFSSAVFVIRAGTVTANVRSPRGLYQIRPVAQGRHLVRQIDTSHFPRDPNDGRPIPPALADAEPALGTALDSATAQSLARAAEPSAPLTATADGSIIDVLIAYAPNARIAAGGTQAIRSQIDLVFAETNQIYANSQINTRLHLAYAYETAYDTSGSQNQDLSRITVTNDGYMDEVHALRDRYGADLVSLWVEGGDYCGIAWVRAAATSAFSVMDRWCAENTFTFAHELGHNFGARHDWYIDGYVDNPSYNKGMVDLTGGWLTVMSYYTKCFDAKVTCRDIPYFSNSNLSYNGRAMGVPQGTSTACQAYNLNNPDCDAENYLIINNRAAAVANFRQPPVQGGGGDTSVIFVSSTSNGRINTLSFADEDILAFDTTSKTWLLVFDGSDVGIRTDINGFEWLPDGTLLFTVNRPTTIAGLGVIDDADIVRFVPERLGFTTAGTFELYLDGSDVDLTTNGEDIDAIAFSPEGDLIISTLGNLRVGALRGKDEDLLRFRATQWGSDTVGTWERYFDGSDVGLTTAQEDLFGLWIDANRGDLYFNTAGSFTLPGLVGEAWDIAVCTPTNLGDTTNCVFTGGWHGADNNFQNEIIDGLALGSLPATFSLPTAAEQATMITAADTDETDATGEEDFADDIYEADEEADEEADAFADEEPLEETGRSSVFLPLINR